MLLLWEKVLFCENVLIFFRKNADLTKIKGLLALKVRFSEILMCLYISTKLQVSKIILTSFWRGGGSKINPPWSLRVNNNINSNNSNSVNDSIDFLVFASNVGSIFHISNIKILILNFTATQTDPLDGRFIVQHIIQKHDGNLLH